MISVPLPLFATLILAYIVLHMLRTRDMGLLSNQLFAALAGLYGLQSLLLSLRWGYGVSAAATGAAILAPILPVLAYLAYLSLTTQLRKSHLWIIGIIAANWLILAASVNLADIAILLTYLCTGVTFLLGARAGVDRLALVQIGQTDSALRAMVFTGVVLILSALVDLFVIVDFIRTRGAHIGLTVTLIQTAFVVCIGVAALMGQTSGATGPEPAKPDITEADDAVMAGLTALFEGEGLHRDMELNLRRIARRMGLPDRNVSQAINKSQGISVSQFVNGYRVKDAATLLTTTDQSILQISLAAGFLSKSNFNREFTRVMGQTPSAFRQAGRADS